MSYLADKLMIDGHTDTHTRTHTRRQQQYPKAKPGLRLKIAKRLIASN